MGKQEKVRVVLDLAVGGIIRGSISRALGVETPFHGWLELANELERARATAAEPDAPAPEIVGSP